MHVKLLVVLILLVFGATTARASEMTDAEVLALAGPRTCRDGYFPYIDEPGRSVNIPVFTLDPGILYEFCFKLKKAKPKHVGRRVSNGFVTLHTANLSDATCGTISAFLIRPNKRTIFGPKKASPRTSASLNQAQPVGILQYSGGVWRALFRLESGLEEKCNKYSVIVSW